MQLCYLPESKKVSEYDANQSEYANVQADQCLYC